MANMLQGRVPYVDVGQLLMDTGVFDQCSLCAKRAWEGIPDQGTPQVSFVSIKQGPKNSLSNPSINNSKLFGDKSVIIRLQTFCSYNWHMNMPIKIVKMP